MSSDLIIPSEINKKTILDQIDTLHEEHRLKVLRELATQFNESEKQKEGLTNLSIDLEKYGDSAFDLIFSLWARHVNIPEGIAYGEPFDDIFSRHAHSSIYSHDLKDFRTVILLRNPAILRFFLISGTRFCGKRGNVVTINESIQQLLKKDGSKWDYCETRPQFRSFLLNPELTEFDIAFLALSFREKKLYYENFYLDDIEYYAGVIPHF